MTDAERCEHGGLRRKCEICQLRTSIAAIHCHARSQFWYRSRLRLLSIMETIADECEGVMTELKGVRNDRRRKAGRREGEGKVNYQKPGVG